MVDKMAGNEFRVGSVLGRSLSVLTRNIVPFGILGLIFTWPLVLDDAEGEPGTEAPSGVDPAGAVDALVLAEFIIVLAIVLGIIFLVIAMYMLCISTMAYGTFQDLRGSRVRVVECLRRGLSTVFPVVGVAFLNTVLVILGTMALIIPGIMLWVALWVAVPVAVVERPGVIASLRRSAWLTKGHRWRIFGIVLVLGLLNGVANSVVLVPFATLTGDAAAAVANVVAYLITVFFMAWGAVAAAVAYHDLRLEKEGVGVNEIAAVFD